MEKYEMPAWLRDEMEYIVQFGVGSTELMAGAKIRAEIIAGRIVCDEPEHAEVCFASAEWAAA